MPRPRDDRDANITIQLPRTIHDRLREVAKQDRRSITSLILILIEMGLPDFRPAWAWEQKNIPEAIRKIRQEIRNSEEQEN